MWVPFTPVPTCLISSIHYHVKPLNSSPMWLVRVRVHFPFVSLLHREDWVNRKGPQTGWWEWSLTNVKIKAFTLLPDNWLTRERKYDRWSDWGWNCSDRLHQPTWSIRMDIVRVRERQRDCRKLSFERGRRMKSGENAGATVRQVMLTPRFIENVETLTDCCIVYFKRCPEISY